VKPVAPSVAATLSLPNSVSGNSGVGAATAGIGAIASAKIVAMSGAMSGARLGCVVRDMVNLRARLGCTVTARR
jgi:hypothetical protein